MCQIVVKLCVSNRSSLRVKSMHASNRAHFDKILAHMICKEEGCGGQFECFFSEQAGIGAFTTWQCCKCLVRFDTKFDKVLGRGGDISYPDFAAIYMSRITD